MLIGFNFNNCKLDSLYLYFHARELTNVKFNTSQLQDVKFSGSVLDNIKIKNWTLENIDFSGVKAYKHVYENGKYIAANYIPIKDCTSFLREIS